MDQIQSGYTFMPSYPTPIIQPQYNPGNQPLVTFTGQELNHSSNDGTQNHESLLGQNEPNTSQITGLTPLLNPVATSMQMSNQGGSGLNQNPNIGPLCFNQNSNYSTISNNGQYILNQNPILSNNGQFIYNPNPAISNNGQIIINPNPNAFYVVGPDNNLVQLSGHNNGNQPYLIPQQTAIPYNVPNNNTFSFNPRNNSLYGRQIIQIVRNKTPVNANTNAFLSGGNNILSDNKKTTGLIQINKKRKFIHEDFSEISTTPTLTLVTTPTKSYPFSTPVPTDKLNPSLSGTSVNPNTTTIPYLNKNPSQPGTSVNPSTTAIPNVNINTSQPGTSLNSNTTALSYLKKIPSQPGTSLNPSTTAIPNLNINPSQPGTSLNPSDTAIPNMNENPLQPDSSLNPNTTAIPNLNKNQSQSGTSLNPSTIAIANLNKNPSQPDTSVNPNTTAIRNLNKNLSQPGTSVSPSTTAIPNLNNKRLGTKVPKNRCKAGKTYASSSTKSNSILTDTSNLNNTSATTNLQSNYAMLTINTADSHVASPPSPCSCEACIRKKEFNGEPLNDSDEEPENIKAEKGTQTLKTLKGTKGTQTDIHCWMYRNGSFMEMIENGNGQIEITPMEKRKGAVSARDRAVQVNFKNNKDKNEESSSSAIYRESIQECIHCAQRTPVFTAPEHIVASEPLLDSQPTLGSELPNSFENNNHELYGQQFFSSPAPEYMIQTTNLPNSNHLQGSSIENINTRPNTLDHDSYSSCYMPAPEYSPQNLNSSHNNHFRGSSAEDIDIKPNTLEIIEKNPSSAREMLKMIAKDIKCCVTPDENGNIPLQLAVLNRDIMKIKRQCMILNEKGPNLISHQNFKYETALMMAVKIAVRSNNIDAVRLLVNEKCDQTIMDDEFFTPLQYAVQHGCTPVVQELLLAKDASYVIEKYSKLGMRPLHIAAYQGYEEIICLLLDRGADRTAKEQRRGRTPYILAINAGHPRSASLLNEYNVNIIEHDSEIYVPPESEPVSSNSITSLTQNNPPDEDVKEYKPDIPNSSPVAEGEIIVEPSLENLRLTDDANNIQVSPFNSRDSTPERPVQPINVFDNKKNHVECNKTKPTNNEDLWNRLPETIQNNLRGKSKSLEKKEGSQKEIYYSFAFANFESDEDDDNPDQIDPDDEYENFLQDFEKHKKEINNVNKVKTLKSEDMTKDCGPIELQECLTQDHVTEDDGPPKHQESPTQTHMTIDFGPPEQQEIPTQDHITNIFGSAEQQEIPKHNNPRGRKRGRPKNVETKPKVRKIRKAAFDEDRAWRP